MAGTKKCAHPPCSCKVPDGQKYCSAPCEAAGKLAEPICECTHPGCEGAALAT